MTAREIRDTIILCVWVILAAAFILSIGGAMFLRGLHYEAVFFMVAAASVGGFVLGLRHAGQRWALEHPEEAHGAPEGAWRGW